MGTIQGWKQNKGVFNQNHPIVEFNIAITRAYIVQQEVFEGSGFHFFFKALGSICPDSTCSVQKMQYMCAFDCYQHRYI